MAASGWVFAAPPAGAAARNLQAEVWLEASASVADAVSTAAAAAAAGCGLVQVWPAALAAVAARLHATAVRVAARIAGPGALASTQLFDAGECLRLGADEIAWPVPAGLWEGAAGSQDAPAAAAIAAAAVLCHAAGARLKLLAAARGDGLEAGARRSGADSLAVPLPAGESAAPAGAIARCFPL